MKKKLGMAHLKDIISFVCILNLTIKVHKLTQDYYK